MASEFKIKNGLVVSGDATISGAATVNGNSVIHTGNVGSYAMSAAGGTLTGDLTLNYGYPRINFYDSNNDSDYSLINNDGSFSIYDITNNSHRLSIAASGNASFTGSINLNGGTLSFNTNYFTINNGGTLARNGGSITLVTDGSTGLYMAPNAGSNSVSLFYANSQKFITGPEGIVVSNSAGNGLIQLTSAGSCVVDILNAQSEAYLRTTSYHDLHFRTNNVNRMMISKDGNVGIGTTSPVSPLDVNGVISSRGISIAQNSGTYNIIYNASNSAAIYLGGSADQGNYYDNTTHYFRSAGGGTNYVVINYLGNVGIGTTSLYSDTKLKVKGVDSGLIFLVSGASYGVRIGANAVGGFISGVDQTGFGSDQALNFRATKYQFDLGNILIGTTTDAGYKLDVSGTGRFTGALTLASTLTVSSSVTAGSFIKSGGTSWQYLKGDGSVTTVDASSDFVRFGEYINQPTFANKTVTLNPSVIKTLLWGGNNIRYTVTDTYTGTYPAAGSTWVKTYELIDGTNSVYSTGNIYLGFWVNRPPANVTVRVQNTSGTWYGPYSGTEIRAGGSCTTCFAYWKVPCGGPNFIKKWEITLTPQDGYTINLQTVDIVIDNSEGIDQTPFVSRNGSSIYGTLSFIGSGPTTNAYITNGGVIGGLVLKVANNTGIIEFQNSGGTKAGSMLMDGSIWRLKSSNSTDTLNIFANGNLGIKQTTDAGYSVDVNGTLRTQYSTYFATTSGNVGIGTTSPSDPLHIVSSGNDKFIRIENTSAYTGIWMNDSGTNSGWLVLSGYTNTTSPGDFAIREYGVQTSLTIKQTTGNVGIGTTSPGRKLDVSTDGGAGNANSYLRITAAAAGAYAFNSFIEGYYNDYGNGETAKIGWINFEGTRPTSNNIGGNINFYTKTLGGLNSADPTVKMTITAAGSVGIGTSSPSQKLHVSGGNVLISNEQYYMGTTLTGGTYKLAGITSGNVVAVGAIDYTSAGTIFAGGDNSSFTTGGIGGATRMYINSSGNIGIGTTSPSTLLTVNGNMRLVTAATQGLFAYDAASGGSFIWSITRYTDSDGNDLNINALAGLAIKTGASSQTYTGHQVYINSSGKVGIGTRLPVGQLNVFGGTGNSPAILTLQSQSGGSGLTGLYFRPYQNETFSNSAEAQAAILAHDASYSAHLKFLTKTPGSGTNTLTERMRLTNTGDLGIGTTTPGDKLEVSGNVYATAFNSIGTLSRYNGTGGLAFAGLAGTTYAYISAYSDAGGSGKNLALQKDGGNVGIGTTSPAEKLDVNGSINATGYKVNGVAGYTGMVTIQQAPPMPPVTFDIQNGIIVNVL